MLTCLLPDYLSNKSVKDTVLDMAKIDAEIPGSGSHRWIGWSSSKYVVRFWYVADNSLEPMTLFRSFLEHSKGVEYTLRQESIAHLGLELFEHRRSMNFFSTELDTLLNIFNLIKVVMVFLLQSFECCLYREGKRVVQKRFQTCFQIGNLLKKDEHQEQDLSLFRVLHQFFHEQRC